MSTHQNLEDISQRTITVSPHALQKSYKQPLDAIRTQDFAAVWKRYLETVKATVLKSIIGDWEPRIKEAAERLQQIQQQYNRELRALDTEIQSVLSKLSAQALQDFQRKYKLIEWVPQYPSDIRLLTELPLFRSENTETWLARSVVNSTPNLRLRRCKPLFERYCGDLQHLYHAALAGPQFDYARRNLVQLVLDEPFNCSGSRLTSVTLTDSLTDMEFGIFDALFRKSDESLTLSNQESVFSFKNKTMKNCEFILSTIQHAEISDCLLTGSVFRNTIFRGVKFKRSIVAKAHFEYCSFEQTTFEECELSYSKFAGCIFQVWPFDCTQLFNTSFTKCEFPAGVTQSDMLWVQNLDAILFPVSWTGTVLKYTTTTEGYSLQTPSGRMEITHLGQSVRLVDSYSPDEFAVIFENTDCLAIYRGFSCVSMVAIDKGALNLLCTQHAILVGFKDSIQRYSYELSKLDGFSMDKGYEGVCVVQDYVLFLRWKCAYVLNIRSRAIVSRLILSRRPNDWCCFRDFFVCTEGKCYIQYWHVPYNTRRRLAIADSLITEIVPGETGLIAMDFHQKFYLTDERLNSSVCFYQEVTQLVKSIKSRNHCLFIQNEGSHTFGVISLANTQRLERWKAFEVLGVTSPDCTTAVYVRKEEITVMSTEYAWRPRVCPLEEFPQSIVFHDDWLFLQYTTRLERLDLRTCERVEVCKFLRPSISVQRLGIRIMVSVRASTDYEITTDLRELKYTAFSEDTTHVIYSEDCTVSSGESVIVETSERRWELETEFLVLSLAIAPNAPVFAVGTDLDLSVYHIHDGTTLYERTGFDQGITHITFLSEPNYLVCCNAYGEVELIDFSQKAVLCHWKSSLRYPVSISCSQRRLAFALFGAEGIELWEKNGHDFELVFYKTFTGRFTIDCKLNDSKGHLPVLSPTREAKRGPVFSLYRKTTNSYTQ